MSCILVERPFLYSFIKFESRQLFYIYVVVQDSFMTCVVILTFHRHSVHVVTCTLCEVTSFFRENAKDLCASLHWKERVSIHPPRRLGYKVIKEINEHPRMLAKRP